MESISKVVIVCPTLSVINAAPVIKEAREKAGVEAGVIVISDYEARGAVHLGNILFNAAFAWGADWVVYLNDDTFGFQQGWLATLLEYGDNDPTCAVVVPGTQCRGGAQAQVKPGGEPGTLYMSSPSAWVVAAIRSRALLDVGPLDENLVHYADDTDWEWRAWAKGWSTLLVKSVWVGHKQTKGEQNSSPFYRKDVTYLKKKHGLIRG